jgi:hypothetical protein
MEAPKLADRLLADWLLAYGIAFSVSLRQEGPSMPDQLMSRLPPHRTNPGTAQEYLLLLKERRP